MTKKSSSSEIQLELIPLDEEDIIKEAGAIGKAMLREMRKIAADKGVHPYTLIQSAIQALIAANSVLYDEFYEESVEESC